MLQLTFHADGWIKHDKASTATSYLDANTAVPVHYELTPIPDGKTAHAYPMMNDGFFPRNDVNYTKSIRCFALRIGTPKKYKNGIVCKITPTLPSAEKCVLAQNLPQEWREMSERGRWKEILKKLKLETAPGLLALTAKQCFFRMSKSPHCTLMKCIMSWPFVFLPVFDILNCSTLNGIRRELLGIQNGWCRISSNSFVHSALSSARGAV